jgi:hypothetical protein
MVSSAQRNGSRRDRVVEGNRAVCHLQLQLFRVVALQETQGLHRAHKSYPAYNVDQAYSLERACSAAASNDWCERDRELPESAAISGPELTMSRHHPNDHFDRQGGPGGSGARDLVVCVLCVGAVREFAILVSLRRGVVAHVCPRPLVLKKSID